MSYIAVMIERRGLLLKGEKATVLNKEIFPTRKLAEERAERQEKFESMFNDGPVRFAVVEIPEEES